MSCLGESGSERRERASVNSLVPQGDLDGIIPWFATGALEERVDIVYPHTRENSPDVSQGEGTVMDLYSPQIQMLRPPQPPPLLTVRTHVCIVFRDKALKGAIKGRSRRISQVRDLHKKGSGTREGGEASQ